MANTNQEKELTDGLDENIQAQSQHNRQFNVYSDLLQPGYKEKGTGDDEI